MKTEDFCVFDSSTLCGILLLFCLLGTIVDVFEWQSCGWGSRWVEESSSINDQIPTTRDEEVPFQASLQPYHNSTTDMSAPLVSARARARRTRSGILAGTNRS